MGVSRSRRKKARRQPRERSVKLRRLVRAMKLAAPWVMVVRWGDLGHCVEMSHAGVALFRKHRIRATVLLCAVVAQTMDHDKGIVVGHNLRSLYDFYSQESDGVGPFDEWAKTQDATLQGGALGQDFPFHLIIEAKDRGDRVRLDLTAGQLRQATGGAIKMPAAVSAFGPRWPLFELEGAMVKYMACPYPEQIDPQLLSFPPNIAGIVDDLDYLTGLALEAPDAEAFNRLMEANANRAQGVLESSV